MTYEDEKRSMMVVGDNIHKLNTILYLVTKRIHYTLVALGDRMKNN